MTWRTISSLPLSVQDCVMHVIQRTTCWVLTWTKLGWHVQKLAHHLFSSRHIFPLPLSALADMTFIIYGPSSTCYLIWFFHQKHAPCSHGKNDPYFWQLKIQTYFYTFTSMDLFTSLYPWSNWIHLSYCFNPVENFGCMSKDTLYFWRTVL